MDGNDAPRAVTNNSKSAGIPQNSHASTVRSRGRSSQRVSIVVPTGCRSLRVSASRRRRKRFRTKSHSSSRMGGGWSRCNAEPSTLLAPNTRRSTLLWTRLRSRAPHGASGEVPRTGDELNRREQARRQLVVESHTNETPTWLRWHCQTEPDSDRGVNTVLRRLRCITLRIRDTNAAPAPPTVAAGQRSLSRWSSRRGRPPIQRSVRATICWMGGVSPMLLDRIPSPGHSFI